MRDSRRLLTTAYKYISFQWVPVSFSAHHALALAKRLAITNSERV